MLKANGMPDLAKDEPLLNHFAYLFIRENPVVFEKDIIKFSEGQSDPSPSKWISSPRLEDNARFVENTNIFEAVQSTNWNNVRFKPSKCFENRNSWLVEFRPLDLPVTSREKFYFVFFVSLLQRIITDPKIFTNFLIPISRADSNMLRSVKRNAVVSQKFFFRRYFFGEKAKDTLYTPKSRCPKEISNKREAFIQNELVEVTLEELLLGGSHRQGLKDLIEYFVEVNETFLEEESKRTGEDIIKTVWECFDFFLKRSQGKLLTTAGLIRRFVRQHPSYRFDSVVEGVVADDLVEFMLNVQFQNYHQWLFG